MKRFWHNILLFITRAYARGIWMPLLCAVMICMLTFGIIFLINYYLGSNIPIGRIIELMLDPGSYDSDIMPAPTFQLIITLVGAVVFTSLLITTVSNMFSNQAEAYRNGEIDLDLKRHVVILGANKIFYNSLNYILEVPGTKVLMTTQPAKEVRAMIASHIGHKKADTFIIVSGDRRQEENLSRISFGEAKRIFILGEDEEKDHDAANIACFKLLCKLPKRTIVDCTIQIDSPEVLLLFSQTRLQRKRIRLTCFNPEELLARTLFINEGKDGILLEFLEAQDNRVHHLIVIGTSSLSSEIAKLYLRLAHYPNFKESNKRTKLTVIDDNDTLQIGLQSNLREVCHMYEYGMQTEATDSIDTDNYYDFLDFEINHIKGKVLDEHVRKVITNICDGEDIIRVVISSTDTDQNFKDSISLPYFIYEKDCPVYVYQPTTGLTIDQENLPDYYDNLRQFGLNISLANVNTVLHKNILRASDYAVLYGRCGNDFENKIVEYDEFLERHENEQMDNPSLENEIHSTTTVMYILYLMLSHPNVDITTLDHFLNTQHLNWVTSQLLFGYMMMKKDELMEYTKRITAPDAGTARKDVRNIRIKYHQHINIAPYDMVSYEAHRYDEDYTKGIYVYLKKKLLGSHLNNPL